jgi:hypothetical protein
MYKQRVAVYGSEIWTTKTDNICYNCGNKQFFRADRVRGDNVRNSDRPILGLFYEAAHVHRLYKNVTCRMIIVISGETCSRSEVVQKCSIIKTSKQSCNNGNTFE